MPRAQLVPNQLANQLSIMQAAQSSGIPVPVSHGVPFPARLCPTHLLNFVDHSVVHKVQSGAQSDGIQQLQAGEFASRGSPITFGHLVRGERDACAVLGPPDYQSQSR